MDEKLTQEILQRVDALAAKLGVGAEVLWAAMVKQALIGSIVDVLLISVVVPCLWWGVWRAAKKLQAKAGEDEVPFFALTVALGAVAVVLTLASIFSLEMVIAGFVNPEYRALHTLMRLGK